MREVVKIGGTRLLETVVGVPLATRDVTNQRQDFAKAIRRLDPRFQQAKPRLTCDLVRRVCLEATRSRGFARIVLRMPIWGQSRHSGAPRGTAKDSTIAGFCISNGARSKHADFAKFDAGSSSGRSVINVQKNVKQTAGLHSKSQDKLPFRRGLEQKPPPGPRVFEEAVLRKEGHSTRKPL